MNRNLLVALLVISFSQALAAGAAPPAASRTLSPYFFVKSDDPSLDRLPLKATSAAVDIVGVIARVTVTQVYRNEGRRALEAIYVFPGSTRAAVHGMTMKVGERVITARIEERQEARRQYMQAMQSGRTASLLEQQRPNVFQMNVANILPGDEIKVELTYSELLVPERGLYEFVYPTVVGPRYSTTDAASAPDSEHWVENPYLRQGEQPTATFDFSARITAGMPLIQVGSPSHRVKVAFAAPTRAAVTLEDNGGAEAGAAGKAGPEGKAEALPSKDAAADRDLVLSYRLADSRIETGLLLGQGADENVFLCMIEPPRRVVPASIPPREYVFIVDVSGSMHGFPLDTTKELLRSLLPRLGPHDFFNVLFFSGGTWVLSPTSLSASESNKAWALQEIDRQHGGGGTELLPALRQAFDLPRARHDIARSIVIATDGYVNVEREAFELVRSRLSDASVFAFGIGSSVNRHLIEGLARVGEGTPFVALNGAEARKVAARFLEYIQAPLLTRVEVKTPGFDAFDLEPSELPDLYAERPLVLVGKYRGAGTGEIVITGFDGHGRFERRIKVANARTADNGVLKVLWARERLALLSDLAVGGGPDEGRRQAVTALGLKYGLLTEFTSFVAIDQRVRRQDGRVETVKQPLPLPAGVSDYAVGGSPSQVRTAAGSIMLASPLPAAESLSPRTEGRAESAQDSLGKLGATSVQVEVIENRIVFGGRPAPNSEAVARSVRDRVRRALDGAGCGASGGLARLKLTFNARGEVDRIDLLDGTGAAIGCTRTALRASVRLAGVVGGYVIVRVSWR